MTADVDLRERRLRKQAELQAMYVNLASLREREKSYMVAQAAIPDMLARQIKELRQQINAIENELLDLDDETVETPARKFYREAMAAEMAEDYEKALKLYKIAIRQAHIDAQAAAQSLRYRIKTKNKGVISSKSWGPVPITRPNKLPLGPIAALLIFLLIALFIFNSYFLASSETVALDAPVTTVASPFITVVIPNTPTPLSIQPPTMTPTPSPSPTTTDAAIFTRATLPPEPIATPTPVPTLKAPPKIIGPRDGLVWSDGAIVFEFEDMDLSDNELYCLDTMRGYDDTLTENWSFPPVGNKKPSIPIEVNVFRIAQLQDISCITWSAYIGQDTCDNVVSKNSEKRAIGLPRPCDPR